MRPTSPSTAASPSHHTLGDAAPLPPRRTTAWARLLLVIAVSVCSGCATLAGTAGHGQVLPAHGEAYHAGVAMPNPQRAPGAIFPGASRSEVCRPGYARSVRHVTLATKRSIYARDHVAYRRGADVVDHLENDGLIWLRCDGLNWPHLRPIVA